MPQQKTDITSLLHPRKRLLPPCQQAKVVICAVFRRCITPEWSSRAEPPTAIRCKPSRRTMSMPQAPSPDIVPHHTDSCLAMPAATVRCQQSHRQNEITPDRHQRSERHHASFATPTKLANQHKTARHHHRKGPSKSRRHRQCQSRVGSQETTPPPRVRR